MIRVHLKALGWSWWLRYWFMWQEAKRDAMRQARDEEEAVRFNRTVIHYAR